jgi:hypothetical protein
MLPYLAAQEHIKDLVREAERYNLAAEVSPPRRITLTVPRFLSRRLRRAVTA